VRLAAQWSEIQSQLGRGWETASLVLTVDDPADAERAAVLLGPAAPVRHGEELRLEVARRPRAMATSPDALARVLARLDRDGVRGSLAVAGSEQAEAEPESVAAPAEPVGLAAEWRALVEALPEDWSHALVTLELRSSDFVDRAALLMSPLNPQLVDGRSTLRFRAARRVGYGASLGMTQRCLERLDAERITGRLAIVQVVSESRPVATQGPVWRLGGRSL
jgi:hypothetical protein